MNERTNSLETRENRLKRLRMRSMRRGIKEMDILLSAFADANLDSMDEARIDLYDRLLHENDQDLYQWVTGQVAAPDPFAELIHDIAQTYQ
ncbi:succinate dehydrogenase assembly factor 2 [Phycobacter azelaicus]|jgi:antitoxin CptB|uniref:succinate dehydrogenase assembly factor 2 n=1 Tax=Phycobacter azelaicus TaxID=2668075 RepID=UPI001866C702|nr:succinate dehydrogenase assembly factor 2 [Phycobacter azelaicus]MBE1294935.1 succinate dehydrogenase assembly factor 2 [Paracoccaceae bacterium]